MNERITLVGNIGFEPENKTKKHHEQASWKHIAMVFIDGDVTEYYAWYIKKRYNLVLNKPLRGGHISFINDSFKDMSLNGQRSLHEVKIIWENVKKKWDGKKISVTFDLSPKTDDRMWWLTIPEDCREELHSIRKELGLGRPFYGLHMSLGYANEKNIEHSKYIHLLTKTGLIT